MKLGDRIRLLRIGSNLSQDNLADEIGVDKSTIVRYEKGTNRRSIPANQLEKIAKVFNLTLSELFSSDVEISTPPERVAAVGGNDER